MPEVPEWFAEKLLQMGGRAPNGEPRLRVSWGGSLRGWPNPDNSPVYVSPDDPEKGWECFILEEWVEPSFFGTPEEWEAQRYDWENGGREIMGAYPSNGAYIFKRQLATAQGEPLPLSTRLLEYIQSIVDVAPENRYAGRRQMAERIKMIREARERKAKETDERLEIVYDDIRTREGWRPKPTLTIPASVFAKARKILDRSH